MKALTKLLILSIAILAIWSFGGDIREMKAYDYVQKRLRLFKEVADIQSKWISLNDEYVGIDSISKKVDWKNLNSKAEVLLDQFQVFYSHFGEDLENIDKELKREDFAKLEPFIIQVGIYIDVFDKTVIKLAKMINKLYQFTLDPESLTFKEHLKEMDLYKKLCEEYEQEGKKLNREVEKTRQMTIDVKRLGLL